MIFRKNLTFQILNQTDHCLEKKIKKVIGLIKYELGKDITKEFVELRAKTYSYIKRKNDKHKKAKETKNVS